MAEEKRRQQRERMRVTETASRDAHLPLPQERIAKATKKKAPNAEKLHTSDPAPVEHADEKPAEDPAAVALEEAKFASKAPYRSRKGDRFS